VSGGPGPVGRAADRDSTRRHDRWGSRWWPAGRAAGPIAALAFAIAAGSFAFNGRGARPPEPAVVRSPALSVLTAGAAPSPTARSRGSFLDIAPSTPVSLRIPAIGLSAPVDVLALNPDATVEVPVDGPAIGWYRLGPAPGEEGSAVILGRLTSFGGPGPFMRLGSLRVGDPVDVTRADGLVVRFVVDAVTTHADGEFPVDQVYGDHGANELHLVTYDGRSGGWGRDRAINVVAWTHLISGTPFHPAGPVGSGATIDARTHATAQNGR
jgi:hypothetical protein